MKCLQCGVDLPQGAKFCSHCGAKQERDAEKMQKANQAEMPEPDAVKEEIKAAEPEPVYEKKQTAEKEVIEEETTKVEVNKVEANKVEQAKAEDNKAKEFKVKEINPEPEQEGGYCPYCGTWNGKDTVFCAACGKVVDGTAPHLAVQHQPVKKEKSPKIVLGAAIGAVLLVAVIAGICLFRNSGSVDRDSCVTYIKSGTLYGLNAKKIKKDPIEYAGNLSNYITLGQAYNMVQFSEDGTYICYPSNIPEARTKGYRLNVAKLGKKSDESTKIDSNVSSYQILKNNKIIFKDYNNTLFISTLEGEKEKVASDVELYYIDPDYKNIVWTEYKNEQTNLYCRDFKLKNEKTKLVSNINLPKVSEDLDIIYVTDMDHTLYAIKNLGEKEKIASGVSLLLHGNYEDGTAYYCKEKEQKAVAMDMVEDDMKASDAALKEPEEKDYQKTGLEENVYTGEYEKVTTTDWDAYEQAQYEFSQKKERDELREQLEIYEMEQSGLELYRYDGKESVLVDENYISNQAATDDVIVYSRFNGKKMQKIKISELSGISDLEQKYESICSDAMETCLFSNGKQTVLTEPISVCSVDQEAKKAYGLTIEGDDYSGVLYSFDIGKNADGSMKKVADNVETIEETSDGDVYYIVDMDSNGGDLYCNETNIDSDVQSRSLYRVGDLLYYKAEADNTGQDYTLRFYNGKEAATIGEDIVCENVMDDNCIIFLGDYSWSSYSGDLQYFNGKESKLIEEDVTWIANTTRKDQ